MTPKKSISTSQGAKYLTVIMMISYFSALLSTACLRGRVRRASCVVFSWMWCVFMNQNDHLEWHVHSPPWLEAPYLEQFQFRLFVVCSGTDSLVCWTRDWKCVPWGLVTWWPAQAEIQHSWRREVAAERYCVQGVPHIPCFATGYLEWHQRRTSPLARMQSVPPLLWRSSSSSVLLSMACCRGRVRHASCGAVSSPRKAPQNKWTREN